MRIDSFLKGVRPRRRVHVMRALSFGMALSVVFLAMMAYAAWSMHASLSKMGVAELRLQQLIGEVAHLNEVLTVYVSMHAATGNTHWVNRYQEAQEKLDATLAEIGSTLAREEYRRNYPADIKLAYSRLLEMESVAMGLVGVGRPAEAMTVLGGTGYETQKELYSTGLAKLSRAMEERMSHELELWRWRIQGTVLLGLMSIGLLSLAWAGAWLLVQRHLHRRKIAEEELASEKERLSVTLRSIGDGVITADTDGKVVLMNRAAELATGWSREEAAGNYLQDVFVMRGGNGISSAHCIELALSQSAETTLGNRCVLVARDRSERIVEGCCTPVQNSSSTPIGAAVVFRDITERSRIEEEALRNEKLESLGLLAGGIAHDFNNMLTGIMLSISMTRTELRPDSCAGRRLEEAEKVLVSAKSLAHQLLAFSKGGHPIKQIASVGDKLHDWVSFAARGSRVKPLLGIPDSLWLSEIDEGQIGQVVNNLVINAVQAMPEGGTIEVSAENVIVGADEQLALVPGRYLRISVRDQGQGIPQEHICKIFDPYFTTKPKGIGLGLTTSYTIMKRH
ncbi:MAG: ATP-binding protein [Thermodesulfobacteriota bacterium]